MQKIRKKIHRKIYQKISYSQNIILYNDDCLKIMDQLIKREIKVDAIIADPPYEKTAIKWDIIIPIDKMWERLNKLIKSNGAIIIFGIEPFSSYLRINNIKNYKYDWVWKKSRPTGAINSKNKPMRILENLSVFSKAPLGHKSLLKNKRMIYKPQGIKRLGKRITKSYWNKNIQAPRPNLANKEYIAYTNFPNDLLEYKSLENRDRIHSTQKPVDLIKYLIKTYTKENELVLDFCMGSGTTGVACKNLNRRFIGIEKDREIFKLAKQRIKLSSKIRKLF